MLKQKPESKDAEISPCGKYRYLLTRGAQHNRLVFLMLNPSTADASNDDPTIRRCLRFARDNGYEGIAVVNLYAYRATDPKELDLVEDPIGRPRNDQVIQETCFLEDVVVAFGARAKLERVKEVYDQLRRVHAYVQCLGVTKSGMPRHPLYVKADQPLVEVHL